MINTIPITQITKDNHVKFLNKFKILSLFNAYLVIFLNLVIVLSWLINNLFLNNTSLDLKLTNPFVATLFILSALTVLLKFSDINSFFNIEVGNILSILIITVGLLGVFCGINPKINQIIFGDLIFSNIISFSVSFNLTILGLSLFTFNNKLFPFARIYHFFALASGILPLFVFLGYFYVYFIFFQFSSFIDIPFTTTITSFLLILSLLFARPNHGILRVFTTPLNVSWLAIRLLIAVFIIPIVLELLIILAQHFELFNIHIGISILVVSIIIIFSLLLWWMVNLLYKNDIEMIHLNESLKAKTLELEAKGEELNKKIKEIEKSKEEIAKLLLYQQKVSELDT